MRMMAIVTKQDDLAWPGSNMDGCDDGWSGLGSTREVGLGTSNLFS